MYKYLIALLILAFALPAHAAQKPLAQIALANGQVLRGQFTETRELQGMVNPFISTGHFVIDPAHGLIWGVEKPMATSTIITPDIVMQDIGGFAVKLPAKNLRHLFDMVGGAMRGNWSALETDFVVTPGGSADHWQMALTPNGNAKTPYASIIVTGSRFVETIIMTKTDGSHDSFNFLNEVLNTGPLTADESQLFSEARPR